MKTLSFFATGTVLILFFSLCFLLGVSACKDSCDSFEITIDIPQDSICLGNSITLSASEDGDYLWSNGATTKRSAPPTTTTKLPLEVLGQETVGTLVTINSIV